MINERSDGVYLDKLDVSTLEVIADGVVFTSAPDFLKTFATIIRQFNCLFFASLTYFIYFSSVSNSLVFLFIAS